MYCFTLVKKGRVHADGKKVIPKEDFSSLLEAKNLIEEARAEADDLIKDAKKKAEEIHEQAKKDGFHEGLEKFNEHLFQFDDTVKLLRHEMQKAVLPLVLKATKRIIGEAIELDPNLVVDIVMQSVRNVSQMHNIKLYVNRSDMETLEAAKDRIKSVFEHLDTFVIEERADVPKGSCMIETERGILNATLDNQFRALERAFEVHMKK